MPRKDLTFSDKIDLLDKIKQHPAKTSHRSLAKLTGVPKSTISRLLRDEERLRSEWATRGDGKGKFRKRKRDGKEPEVEEALNRWFEFASQFIRISGPVLKAKAENLAKQLGREGFKATNGWLSRWKSRNEISLRKSKGSSDADAAGKWKTSKLPELLQQFCADDIYSARETVLFYRATPDGSLCYKKETLAGCKKAMDHVTVLCCCNMSGSDRRKLLVVGKMGKSKCFCGFRMDALPVLYCENKNARISCDIFSSWLSEWDVELQRESRRILLVVDNQATHRSNCLKNVRLEFLPLGTTPILQPMEMGIVRNLKVSYRGKLVSFILETIEENLLQKTSAAKDVSGKVNMLQAMQFLADSWREMSSNIIRNSFAKCGWEKRMEQTQTDGNSNDDSALRNVENYEDFIAIDENISDGDCKDEDSNRDTEDEEEIQKVSHRDAKKFVAGLQLYFMQTGNEGSPVTELDVCADFVQRQYTKKGRENRVLNKED